MQISALLRYMEFVYFIRTRKAESHEEIVEDTQEKPKDLNDARRYYHFSIDPDENFNKVEITLSHLFRSPSPMLGGRSYGESLYEFLESKGSIRESVIEIGGGLGDVAREFVSAANSNSHQISNYSFFDISPSLLHRQSDALKGVRVNAINGDCTELSNYIQGFNGLIICNGVIADLRSVYVTQIDDPILAEVDSDIVEFANSWFEKRGAFYLHLGTLEFLRELSFSLQNGCHAMVSEYLATPINQPSWFDNHYECGIEFDQLIEFLKDLPFEVSFHDTNEVLGLDVDQTLLSMDIFTAQDKVARDVPETMKIWRGRTLLPVLGYSVDTLRDTLKSSEIGLSETDAELVAKGLKDYFHTIDEAQFDSKNPTTWSYRYLVLRKVPSPNAREDADSITKALLQTSFGMTPEQSQSMVSKIDDLRMSGGAELVELGSELITYIEHLPLLNEVVTSIFSDFFLKCMGSITAFITIFGRGIKKRRSWIKRKLKKDLDSMNQKLDGYVRSGEITSAERDQLVLLNDRLQQALTKAIDS